MKHTITLLLSLVAINAYAIDIDPATGFPVNAIPKFVQEQMKDIQQFDAVEYGTRDLSPRAYISRGGPSSPTGVTSVYTPGGLYTVSRAGSVTFIGRAGTTGRR